MATEDDSDYYSLPSVYESDPNAPQLKPRSVYTRNRSRVIARSRERRGIPISLEAMVR